MTTSIPLDRTGCRRRYRLLVFLPLLAASACGPGPRPEAEAAPEVSIREVGRYNFRGGGSPVTERVAEELSGLVRLEGDRYVSVGDEHAALHFLRIRLERETGRVASAAFDHVVPLTGADGTPLPGPDREAVALDPGSGGVWIADERRAPTLRLHVEGRSVAVVDPSSHPMLRPFSAARPNLGFESLTRSADGGYWAANEEALSIDGPTATPERGSVVRLVRFDARMTPTAQFAYVTDPVPGPISSPLPAVGNELSGLVELVALPGGGLLGLERALGGDESGMGGFRIRIYEIDTAGATDVSRAPYLDGLEGKRYEPASKRRLLDLRLGLPVSNFEAMALGPTLPGGDRSLLLMADNRGGTRQSIYALRISGLDDPADAD